MNAKERGGCLGLFVVACFFDHFIKPSFAETRDFKNWVGTCEESVIREMALVFLKFFFKNSLEHKEGIQLNTMYSVHILYTSCKFG